MLLLLDIGWTELALILVVAVVFIGPKDLPVVLRTMGRMTRRARMLLREFQGSVEDMVRESEFGEGYRDEGKAPPAAAPKASAKSEEAVMRPLPPPAPPPEEPKS